MATVSGNIVDCNNLPVSNGSIIMNRNGFTYRYNVSPAGAFNFATSVCGSNNVTFLAEDVTASQQGSLISYILTAGANSVGTLSTCGLSTLQFVNCTIDGVPHSYSFPTDSIAAYVYPQGWPDTTFIISASRTTYYDGIGIQFFEQDLAAGAVVYVHQFWPHLMNQYSPPGLVANITEYGGVNEYIAGNISGILSSQWPGNPTYNVTCSFRVKIRLI